MSIFHIKNIQHSTKGAVLKYAQLLKIFAYAIVISYFKGKFHYT